MAGLVSNPSIQLVAYFRPE